MKSTGDGAAGCRFRCIGGSSSRRSPLRRLHGPHAVTTFSQTESPPRLRGTSDRITLYEIAKLRPETERALNAAAAREMVQLGRTAHRGVFSRPAPRDRERADESIARLRLQALAERPVQLAIVRVARGEGGSGAGRQKRNRESDASNHFCRVLFLGGCAVCKCSAAIAAISLSQPKGL